MDKKEKPLTSFKTPTGFKSIDSLHKTQVKLGKVIFPKKTLLKKVKGL